MTNTPNFITCKKCSKTRTRDQFQTKRTGDRLLKLCFHCRDASAKCHARRKTRLEQEGKSLPKPTKQPSPKKSKQSTPKETKQSTPKGEPKVKKRRIESPKSTPPTTERVRLPSPLFVQAHLPSNDGNNDTPTPDDAREEQDAEGEEDDEEEEMECKAESATQEESILEEPEKQESEFEFALAALAASTPSPAPVPKESEKKKRKKSPGLQVCGFCLHPSVGKYRLFYRSSQENSIKVEEI